MYKLRRISIGYVGKIWNEPSQEQNIFHYAFSKHQRDNEKRRKHSQAIFLADRDLFIFMRRPLRGFIMENRDGTSCKSGGH